MNTPAADSGFDSPSATDFAGTSSDADDSGIGIINITALFGDESICMESDIDKDDADYIPDMYSSSERDWGVGFKARIQKAIDFSIEGNDNARDENEV